MALLLETVWGDLVLDLDVSGSPALCKNIVKLAKARFYTNSLIFSLKPQRFCQAGCPVGDGSGGTSIYGLLDDEHKDYTKSMHRFLKSEGRPLSSKERQEKGRVVACPLPGVPDTVGSQFLITLGEGPDQSLDGYDMVVQDPSDRSQMPFLSLGTVAEDQDGVLDKIAAAYTDPEGRPFADIRIIRALVVEDPFDDPDGMDKLLKRRNIIVDGDRVTDSPSPDRPPKETVPVRISIAEVTEEDDEDLTQIKERQKENARREDRSRAVVLEMLGDLPDADIQAPDNVLFICKLNAITQDDDLELIFSRFDSNVKVEVVRDQDTGSSLQYAFAEFGTKQAAVEAYFKMNNALVDDRRIKVDFSQSVSKVWDKYNQRLRRPRTGAGGNFEGRSKARMGGENRSSGGPLTNGGGRLYRRHEPTGVRTQEPRQSYKPESFVRDEFGRRKDWRSSGGSVEDRPRGDRKNDEPARHYDRRDHGDREHSMNYNERGNREARESARGKRLYDSDGESLHGNDRSGKHSRDGHCNRKFHERNNHQESHHPRNDHFQDKSISYGDRADRSHSRSRHESKTGSKRRMADLDERYDTRVDGLKGKERNDSEDEGTRDSARRREYSDQRRRHDSEDERQHKRRRKHSSRDRDEDRHKHKRREEDGDRQKHRRRDREEDEHKGRDRDTDEDRHTKHRRRKRDEEQRTHKGSDRSEGRRKHRSRDRDDARQSKKSDDRSRSKDNDHQNKHLKHRSRDADEDKSRRRRRSNS